MSLNTKDTTYKHASIFFKIIQHIKLQGRASTMNQQEANIIILFM